MVDGRAFILDTNSPVSCNNLLFKFMVYVTILSQVLLYTTLYTSVTNSRFFLDL